MSALWQQYGERPKLTVVPDVAPAVDWVDEFQYDDAAHSAEQVEQFIPSSGSTPHSTAELAGRMSLYFTRD